VASDDRLREFEERYEGYEVYDNAGEKIGRVDDLFVDETDHEEYIGVKMGFFGLRSTLIPMEVVRVDEREQIMEVAESKDHVKDAPTFDDDDDITSEYEDRVRRHFGLESLELSAERGSYGRYAGTASSRAAAETGGEDRDRTARETYRNRENIGSGSAMESAGAADTALPGSMADLETGERGRVGDEGYRKGYREGYREGFREGLREGGRGEVGDRGEPGGIGAGDRDSEQGRPGDRAMDAVEPGEESRERQLRSSDEGEREEGGLNRVWRRMKR
jgi:hypothetical protein